MSSPETLQEFWDNRPETSWKLGGIYTFKPGYHASVRDNLVNWPSNYSVRFRLDLDGVRHVGRAIDLTMSSSLMKLYTGRLVKAADSRDPRMLGVREFYGTVDGSRVIGRIRDDDSSSYRSSSSDSSHLWHIHISFWATHVTDWVAVMAVLSILKGESVEEFNATMLGTKLGDKSEAVGALQYLLDRSGFDPGDIDRIYGPMTSSAVLAARKSVGSKATNGDKIDLWAYIQLFIVLIRATAKTATPTDAQVNEAVAKKLDADPSAIIKWLEAHKDELRGPEGVQGPEGPAPSVITVEYQVKNEDT